MAVDLDAAKTFDSITYRKMLEFIEKEGTEPFEKFIEEVAGINEKTLIERAVIQGNQPLMGLIQRNKVVVEFLRQLQNNFLASRVRRFVVKTSNNMDKLDEYIENAKRLEELKVCRITFTDFMGGIVPGLSTTEIWSDKSGKITTIRKNYTDGTMIYNPLAYREEYKEYAFDIFPNDRVENSPTFLLQTENHADGKQFRYAAIEDFGFNGQELPTEEELRSYEEPKTLQLFRKM